LVLVSLLDTTGTWFHYSAQQELRNPYCV